MQKIKHSIREVNGKYRVIRTTYTSDGEPVSLRASLTSK